MAEANPRTSSGVTPLARSAASSAPAIAGASAGSVSARISPAASASVRSRRSRSCSSTIAQFAHDALPPARSPSRSARKLPSSAGPSGREDALRVKLHAFDRELAVTRAHDLALARARRHLEHVRHGLGTRDERVIATRREGPRQPGEDAGTLVLDQRDLAMHQPTRTHDLAAPHLDHRLVAEAHAEHRHPSGERLDHPHRHACLARRARTGRDAQMRRRERRRRLDRDRVVAMHQHLRAQHHERLHEVVGEAVVVVDQEQARRGHLQALPRELERALEHRALREHLAVLRLAGRCRRRCRRPPGSCRCRRETPACGS